MIAIAVTLAGGVGAMCRYLVDSLIKDGRTLSWPWATVIINISGSALLGLLTGVVLFHSAPSVLEVVLGTGFCGGYTTFSTASMETVRLAEQRRMMAALGQASITLTSCVVCVMAVLLAAWVL